MQSVNYADEKAKNSFSKGGGAMVPNVLLSAGVIHLENTDRHHHAEAETTSGGSYAPNRKLNAPTAFLRNNFGTIISKLPVSQGLPVRI